MRYIHIISQSVLSRHIKPAAAQADPILPIWTILAAKLKASCLKSSFFWYTDSGWHLAAGQYISVPSVTASALEKIQQAFQLPPLLAEGYLSLDSHKAHHTNISPPAMPLSYCSAITSAMVLGAWQNVTPPPLICLHLSTNLSAAHIPAQVTTG